MTSNLFSFDRVEEERELMDYWSTCFPQEAPNPFMKKLGGYMGSADLLALCCIIIKIGTDCFSHRQLHVACSRVGKPDNLYTYTENGITKIVKYFIEEKGIDPIAAINEYGSTLFGEAIVGGGLDTMQYLMSQKDVTYNCSDQGQR
ncbi:hypothetical protein TNCV_2461581 [Trichonephila clavipes]|nr:hypothetical protein TNCV_2461581 [Trichonephila clavipes]